MDELDEIVAEFLVESRESLDRHDRDLLSLEQDPGDRDALASVFRTMHTIKGTCGFLGFANLEAFTHVAEGLLGRLRDGEIPLDSATTSLLLEAGDAVRAMLEVIEATGADDPDPRTDLLDRLAAATDPGERLGALLVGAGATDEQEVELALHAQDLGDGRPIGEILVHQSEVGPDQVEQALHQQAASRGGETVRVDVDVLDELMRRVGELVLARNQIVALVERGHDTQLGVAAQRLDLITTELQDGVMRTRMQPIGHAWSRLPRIVRDMARASGKQVGLVREGGDTELDRTVLEAIRDPLTHLVRNAIDHGLEAPAERVAGGKPPTGTVVLRAFHEGGQVHVEIRDDGRGIDVERVRAKAVERGLVSHLDAATLSDREVLDLVFQPGFSTAEAVTNVSGRGVGMDVVRTNVEAIGGSVDVRSRPGEGTRFALAIPLTLAIIPALVVTSAGQRFAIPQGNLVELVRVVGDHAHPAVEHVHGAPVHRLRGRLLPLVRLSEALGTHDDAGDDGSSIIVVLQADGRRFGLVVDAVSDTAEIVVTPLDRQLKAIAAFAGATILGDGRVALILDVSGLARRVGIESEVPDAAVPVAGGLDRGPAATTTSLLVCDDGGRRVGLPLADVARLETVPPSRIERSGEREVVQYRGSVMPLLRLGAVLDPSGAAGARHPDRPLDVVVHAVPGGHVGLVVDRILDVVDVAMDLAPPSRPGVRGTVVVDGQVTEVTDLDGLLAAAGLTGDLVVA